MKKYYNKEKNEWYYEGTTVARKIEHGIFSGYPTEEHLKAWGFEEYVEPVEDGEPVVEDEPVVEGEPVEEGEPVVEDEPVEEEELTDIS